MTTEALARPITRSETETFDQDGVVLLRAMFSDHWIALLRSGLETHRRAPTPRARIWDRDGEGRTMFWDSMAWQDVPQYRRFVFQSPAAEIAGRLLGSESVRFFFDAVFVRSPGTQFQTPWHQDEPYWSVDGHDTCTIWMPLVSVKKKNALAFVPRSHRTGLVLDQPDFGRLNPDAKPGIDRSDFSAIAEADIPDIDADRASFGVRSWDMEPGDCVVFNGRTLHGGSGLMDPDKGLSVFTSKWLGDDVRIAFREEGMDPDFSDIISHHGLAPGDRPGTDLMPCVWTAPG